MRAAVDEPPRVSKGKVMNVTNEQLKAARSGEPVELTANGDVFVLLAKDVFERVKPALAYDDSNWTEEEMRHMAARTFEDADHCSLLRSPRT